MPRAAFVVLGGLSLGCGGVFGPPFDLAVFEDNYRRNIDDPPRALFGSTAVSGRLGPACAFLGGGLVMTPPGSEGEIAVASRQEPMGSLCSFGCGDAAIDLLAAGGTEADAARMAFADCDAEGPDPLFDAATLPLRGATEPAQYVLARRFWTLMSPLSASVRRDREALALGLAVRGIERLPPIPLPPDIDRTADLPADLRDRVAACGPVGRQHIRVLFDPAGTAARRWRPYAEEYGGPSPCVAAVFDGLQVPPRDTWSAVDVELE
jgi:hypothetical protein